VDFEANFGASIAPRKVNILPSFFGADSRRGPAQQLAKKEAIGFRPILLQKIPNVLSPLKP
jgi:hypothetical protein